ncbi:MAG: hypothetical protein EOP58_11790 [Sphingomonadales bacterium]|nr:MAG: hypothetical protein EOP58_11790 [Sphingomonadales bacterium]
MKMIRMTTGLLLAGSLLAVAAPAAAQDAGRTWTGPYVGAQLGYAFQPKDSNEVVSFDTNLDGTFGDQVSTAARANAFSPGFCGGGALTSTRAAGCRTDNDSVNWRVHAGYDYQLGTTPFVVGAVAEFGRTHTLMDSVTAFSTTPAFYTMSREYRYGANVRARAGYTRGDTMVYATGGGSWASVYKRFATNNVANTFSFDRRDNAYGWNAGGGIEQRIGDHFSIGAMYLFTGLNDKNRDVNVSGGPATSPFRLVNASGTDMRRAGKYFYFSTVNIVANWRF